MTPNGSALKGSWPLKGSTVGGGAVEETMMDAVEGGRELAEELLDMWEELPPEKGSLLPPNSSSPVADTEDADIVDYSMCVHVCTCMRAGGKSSKATYFGKLPMPHLERVKV